MRQRDLQGCTTIDRHLGLGFTEEVQGVTPGQDHTIAAGIGPDCAYRLPIGELVENAEGSGARVQGQQAATGAIQYIRGVALSHNLPGVHDIDPGHKLGNGLSLAVVQEPGFWAVEIACQHVETIITRAQVHVAALGQTHPGSPGLSCGEAPYLFVRGLQQVIGIRSCIQGHIVMIVGVAHRPIVALDHPGLGGWFEAVDVASAIQSKERRPATGQI